MCRQWGTRQLLCRVQRQDGCTHAGKGCAASGSGIIAGHPPSACHESRSAAAPKLTATRLQQQQPPPGLALLPQSPPLPLQPRRRVSQRLALLPLPLPLQPPLGLCGCQCSRHCVGAVATAGCVGNALRHSPLLLLRAAKPAAAAAAAPAATSSSISQTCR